MTPGPRIEPGTHWWKASALTTTPTLLPDQTGFIKGRFIGQNVRLLNDVMEYTEARNHPTFY